MSLLPRPRRRLIWHRRDLRLHDNDIYPMPNEDGQDNDVEILPLFIFDAHEFTPQKSMARPVTWDTQWMGPFATKVLVEAVQDLRQSLLAKGHNLMVRYGKPLEIIPQAIQSYGISEVVWHEEVGHYEQALSRQVQTTLRKLFPNVRMTTTMQYTLYHPDDLPRSGYEWDQLAHPKQKRKGKNGRRVDGPLSSDAIDDEEGGQMMQHNLIHVSEDRWKGIPKIMGDFRRAAASSASVRPATDPPDLTKIKSLKDKNFIWGDIPTVRELMKPLQESKKSIMGLSSHQIAKLISDAEQSSLFQGGEKVALARLYDFVHSHGSTAQRNMADVISDNQSSLLSVHLATGSLSPRLIYHTAKKAQATCEWLASHMTMRDFFLYTCLASGSKFYQQGGIPVNKKRANSIVWIDWNERTERLWTAWRTGATGLPLVDAAMLELLSTGYCSNRVRQNAVSVLTNDMRIDWRAGAELYQLILVDHCVGANYGNWLYFASIGNDPKVGR